MSISPIPPDNTISPLGAPSTSDSSSAVASAAVTFLTTTQLGAVAAKIISPVIAEPAPSTNTDVNLQAFYDLSQIDLLYAEGKTKDDPAVKVFWNDLKNLATNPNLYNASITVNIPFTPPGPIPTPSTIIFNPAQMVQQALAIYNDPSKSPPDFRNWWSVPPTTGTSGALAAYAFLLNTDPNFDMSFSWAQTTTPNLMHVYSLMTDLNQISLIPGASPIDTSFFGFNTPFGGSGNFAQEFPQFVAAYFYQQNLDASGQENWDTFNAQLQTYIVALPAGSSGTPNYQSAYTIFQNMKGVTFSSWSQLETAAGGTAASYMTVLADVKTDLWLNFIPTPPNSPLSYYQQTGTTPNPILEPRASKNTDVNLQTFYDLSQIHILYSEGISKNDPSVQQFWNDLQSLSSSPNLYTAPLTVTLQTTPTQTATITPSSYIKTALTLYNDSTKSVSDFQNWWQKGDPSSPTTPSGSVAALAFLHNTDPNFDMNFSWIPSSSSNLMQAYTIMTDLSSNSSDLQIDSNFWGLSTPNGAGSFAAQLPRFVAAYYYQKNLNPSGQEDWTTFNSQYQAYIADLPPPAANNPNYTLAYNVFQSMKGINDLNSWDKVDKLSYSSHYVNSALLTDPTSSISYALSLWRFYLPKS